jgi:hypothetical protein
MPLLDLYSSRDAEARRTCDVWLYDRIPDALRVQVSNIVRDALGSVREYSENSKGVYAYICSNVAHEHGREQLVAFESRAWDQVHACIKKEQSLAIWLDVVELTFRLIEKFQGQLDDFRRIECEIKLDAEDAIHEVKRFGRAGFGYRYEGGKLLRLDSERVHQEITVPALKLLSDARFTGADQEFRAAHDHMKAGQFRDCAVDALNALESTMKAVCDAKGWKYEKGARATDLIKVLKSNGLFPDFADQSFDQLIATLKSGLPLVRNETGAHGQGSKPVEVPEFVAVYALNLAASKIRLLFEAFAASEK